MSESFSEFWQTHQQDLRRALQTAHDTARLESERISRAELFKR
jgi:hypothetical protein